MTLRCLIDGLLLPAVVGTKPQPTLTAWDGDEAFHVEAVEARFYEMVSATQDEVLRLEQSHYRLLQPANDFRLLHR